MRPTAARVIALVVILALPAIGSAQTPTSVTVVGSTPCGKNPNAKVNLSGPAPAGGLVITLASSVPGTVTIPPSVTALEGANSASFLVTCVQTTQSIAVNLSATANGVTQTALLNVLAPVLTAISVQPHHGGATATGQVAILAPAGPSGVMVTLSSDNTKADVPASVTVPSGAATTPFTVNASPVGEPTPVSLLATGLGVSKNVTFNLVPAEPVSVKFPFGGTFLNTASIVGGNRQTALLTLSGIAVNGPDGVYTAQLSTDNPAATVPPSVSVSPGTSAKTFFITTSGVDKPMPVTISATEGGVTRSAQLTVMPAQLDFIGGSSNAVGGQTLSARAVLTGAAPAGGFAVQLISSNPAVATVPASITVQPGQTDGPFSITTHAVESQTNASITVTAGGVTRIAPVTISPAGPTDLSVNPASVTGGVTATGAVATAIVDEPYIIVLTSTNPEVVNILPSLDVAPGTRVKAFPVHTVPVLQSTFVSITAKTGSVVQSASITVKPPVISSLTIIPSSVTGAQHATGQIALNGPAPAGYTVSISSVDSTFAAPAAFSVTVPPGATTATFSINTVAVPSIHSVRFTVDAQGTSQVADLTVKP